MVNISADRVFAQRADKLIDDLAKILDFERITHVVKSKIICNFFVNDILGWDIEDNYIDFFKRADSLGLDPIDYFDNEYYLDALFFVAEYIENCIKDSFKNVFSQNTLKEYRKIWRQREDMYRNGSNDEDLKRKIARKNNFKIDVDSDFIDSVVEDMRKGYFAKIKFYENVEDILVEIKSEILDEFNISDNDIRLVVAGCSVENFANEDYENLILYLDLFFQLRVIDCTVDRKRTMSEKIKKRIKYLLEKVFEKKFDVKIQFC